jgi:hypothetical protein
MPCLYGLLLGGGNVRGVIDRCIYTGTVAADKAVCL